MPRQLPWKVNTTTTKSTATPRAAASSASTRLTPHSRTATPSSTTTKPRRSLTLEATSRSPSPSPPPSPVREEQMHTPHDDRFRMVEDEFLATAQQFTRHLHHAEYQRLKDAAAARAEGDAEAIRNGERLVVREIVRPVVGGPGAGRAAERRRERDAGAGAGGGLRGLLSSPPRREVPVLVLGGRREGSPLAGRGVKKEEGDGSRRVVKEEDRVRDDVGRKRTGTEAGRKRGSEVPESKRERVESEQPAVPSEDDDEEDKDDFFTRMRAKREEKRRKRESAVKRDESPTMALDDIPFI